MGLACKICIAEHGLRGSDIANLLQTEKGLVEHIESVHHTPVIRDGETEEMATRRFLREHPEAASCSECKKNEAVWTWTDHGGP